MRITITIDVADGVALSPSEALMTTVAEIKAALAAEHDQIASIKGLITGLVAAVEANKTDPAALDEILAEVKANTADLTAATLAGTPAAPAVEAPATADAGTFPASPADAPAGPADGQPTG